MGFSSALQGRAAHEALIVRQDAELRLMETMKRSIQMRAKCDREYAIGLAAVAQQGLKIDRADDLQGSLITKSWRSYMDDLDQQAKQFKANAELLEVVSEKIVHLSQDKRKARKSYQEEHSKIAARLNHLTDEVIRKKSEYQKHLEGYKALRTRFEEHYIKSGRGGRKLDDVRDKYQKACRKLHLTHNEYVLSITEAVEVEKDFRTVLLPGLLEHQQSVQESFILLWKNILQDACQHSDLTSDKFKDIQKRIETTINNINPNEEYREFTEKHKTSPATPIVFQFDESLIEDIPGKLQANTLTVDNLTVDWLRSRLNDLEFSLKDCQDKQIKMIGDLNGGSPHSNGGLNGIINKDSQKQSKDLKSVRCQEKQKQKLVEMIKTALSEVGCEELPSGCDDHLTVDQSFIENNFNNDPQATSNISVSSVASMINKKTLAEVLAMWRPFKRKSMPPQPTTPTVKPRFHIRLPPRSHSLGSLTTVTNCLNDVPKADCKWRMYSSVNACNEIATNIDFGFIAPNVFETYDFPKNNKPVLCALEQSSTNIYAELDIGIDSALYRILNSKTKVEINHNEQLKEDANKGLSKNQDPKTASPPPVPESNGNCTKSSIDAHLDKIDEINRTLDDNLKKSLPLERVVSVNLDAIEPDIVSPETVQNRKPKKISIDDNIELIESSSSNRSSTSNEQNQKMTTSKAYNSAKRSVSFTHKSINNFLTNIKEFKFQHFKNSGSNKANSKLPADTDINKILEGVAEFKAASRSIVNPTYCGELKTTQKPKMEKVKKSKKNRLFNFHFRRGKICRKCSKQRRIHPSRSVADFAKEFGTIDDFCSCPSLEAESRPTAALTKCEQIDKNSLTDDDDIFFKDHNYCEPFLNYSTSRPLYEEEWFHGVLPREEVVRLLKVDGDFLVRETTRNEESQIVLSVCWNGHKHFIVQTTLDGNYRFEGPPFPSIQELIMHQYQSETAVTVKSGAILRRPVSRERWELCNDDVGLLEKIGRGNFGDVYKAKLKSTKLDVAVKTCRMTLPDEQKRKFLQEGRILKQYDHPNIVKLIGICVQKQPIMIVMELVPGGSLLNFLRKNSNGLSARQLMGMCRDAAAGMRYLESKNCIHRDLAARNCLIDLENSVKISDFGMSREEEEYIVSDGMKQIPVKWTAPEALNFGKYTSLCDVWSYGILMWEIFSKGDTPYSGMSNSRARERIDQGYRMPSPENTPPEMHRLMLKTWAAEADQRPHFDEIFTVVDALIIRYDG